MTERYELRPITPGEFEAFNEVPIQAFNDAKPSAEAIEQERLVFEFDRSLAAVEDYAIVGTAAAYSFQLTVPGGIASTAGVTFVSVRPSHRRPAARQCRPVAAAMHWAGRRRSSLGQLRAHHSSRRHHAARCGSGAGYLGGTRLGALAAAGLVTEPKRGALARLSAAMHAD